MSSGAYLRRKYSEEWKRKMSEIHKRLGTKPPSFLGKHHNEETRAKMSRAKCGKNNPMFGTQHSDEWKKMMSEVSNGRKHTEEAKKRISEAKKGKPNGRLGKHHSEETKKKMSLARIGRKNTEETKRKLSEALKGRVSSRKGCKGEPLSSEAKHHLSEINKGKKISIETKRKMREARISNPNRVFKDTSIELKIEEELRLRNINYQKQVPLCKVAIVDFYLPEYRIVIQCDGDYWHNRPGRKEKDERQDKVLTFNGFNVYRFWEHEINKSPQKCIDIIAI